MGCARWLASVGVTVVAALVLAGCDDETPSPDADVETDADVEVDADADAEDFPPFDCVTDDDLNMTTCMLPATDAGTEWGLWCDGDCRPACAAQPHACPPTLTCHRSGSSYLCFPPE